MTHAWADRVALFFLFNFRNKQDLYCQIGEKCSYSGSCHVTSEGIIIWGLRAAIDLVLGAD